MRAIFISYRREDSEGQAGRLFKDLSEHFGDDCVFMDVTGIEPGRDFRRVIDAHVASCGVLLAMIGKSWIDAKDDSGRRRLDDPRDFVRLETAAALKRDIPVIPVLVHGAQMPRVDQLPEDLAELSYRNGVELTHARWDSDVQLLVKALDPYVESNQKTLASSGVRASHQPPTGSASAATTVTSEEQPIAASKRRVPALALVALAAVLALGIGGYAWSLRGNGEELVPPPSESDTGGDTSAGHQAPEAEPGNTPDENTSSDEEQRARWRTYEFPPPNGGFLVYTILPDGNPACASYDASGCLWGVTYDELDFSKLKPLECGEAHRTLFGVTGFDDPKHWCSLAKVVRGSPS